MNNGSQSSSNLDPQLREKLLNETKNPLAGPRRFLWIVLFASACLGLLIMTTRWASGEVVLLSDFAIQIGAFLFFGGLIYFDRKKDV